MKKYKCIKCGDWFFGVDDHFKYTPNICEKCNIENTYKEVPKLEYEVSDYGYIIDDELENANYHSFCGIGKSLCNIINLYIQDEKLKRNLMKEICKEFYKLI